MHRSHSFLREAFNVLVFNVSCLMFNDGISLGYIRFGDAGKYLQLRGIYLDGSNGIDYLFLKYRFASQFSKPI